MGLWICLAAVLGLSVHCFHYVKSKRIKNSNILGSCGKKLACMLHDLKINNVTKQILQYFRSRFTLQILFAGTKLQCTVLVQGKILPE